MRKIIWTIAIVFCVQVAFQLAMTANRTDSSYASLRTPLQNGIDTPSPPLDDDSLDTNIAPVESQFSAAGSPVQTRILVRYVRVPEFRAHAPERSTAAFKPVVITYDRTGALTGGSQTTTAGRQRTEKPRQQSDDNRSLVAKVVTKPYDWLRAVGSKLR
jgi:hypothetical protein